MPLIAAYLYRHGRRVREIAIDEAARRYMEDVLQNLPDEQIALSAMESMGPLANPFDPSQGFLDEDSDKPYDPWEDGDESPDAEEEQGSAFLDIAALRAKAAKA